MLVLQRKVNEVLWIGEDICVMVVGVQGRAVRLGVTCPDEMRILRGEIKPKELDHGSEVGTENIGPKDSAGNL